MDDSLASSTGDQVTCNLTFKKSQKNFIFPNFSE